jgi:hypothetical protein
MIRGSPSLPALPQKKIWKAVASVTATEALTGDMIHSRSREGGSRGHSSPGREDQRASL